MNNTDEGAAGKARRARALTVVWRGRPRARRSAPPVPRAGRRPEYDITPPPPRLGWERPSGPAPLSCSPFAALEDVRAQLRVVMRLTAAYVVCSLWLLAWVVTHY